MHISQVWPCVVKKYMRMGSSASFQKKFGGGGGLGDVVWKKVGVFSYQNLHFFLKSRNEIQRKKEGYCLMLVY